MKTAPITVLDPGHRYLLPHLDGNSAQELCFVKREGEGFPGNVGHHEGTNMQSVLRALIDRIGYLENQIPHKNNTAVYRRLVECIWFLEQRAAERHGYEFNYRLGDIMEMEPCAHCGHIVCRELGVDETRRGGLV